jgi:toxin ParE1/3/4
MKIRWTLAAVADLQAISDYLKANHPRYRQPTLRKVYERIRGLKDAPSVGRPGRIEGTRELLFPPMPYVAVYRVRGETIEVWRVFHTSQDRTV